MMGMPIEVRDRWVAALRSGEYEQGDGEFTNRGRFCCLGVLCDVTGQPLRTGGGDNYPFVLSLIPGDQINRLWNMNDLEGKSFAEIADYIEREVPVS